MLPRSLGSGSDNSWYRSRASEGGLRISGIALTRQTCGRPDQKKVWISPWRTPWEGFSTFTRLSRTEPCSMNSRAIWRLLTSRAHHKYLSRRISASGILLVDELRAKTAQNGERRIGVGCRCRRTLLSRRAFCRLAIFRVLGRRRGGFRSSVLLLAALALLAAERSGILWPPNLQGRR